LLCLYVTIVMFDIFLKYHTIEMGGHSIDCSQ